MTDEIRFPELAFPDGLSPRAFLQRHWQRAPLLMRQALPGFENPLPADELAGLACEPDVEARIVEERGDRGPWQVRHGPFDAAAFAALPASHWTLLVQDVDKHLPELGAVLGRFAFVPQWRLDDLMISYAEDQGSVGPHVDDYDVFLLQAEGRRRWLVSTDPQAPHGLIPDLELRILERFEPDAEWVLEPGDLLYLPPGVPHWGIAEGRGQTWSIGLRAPAWHELADDWFAYAAERFAPAGRWRDPSASVPADPAELDAATAGEMRRTLEAAVTAASADAFRVWLGTLLTEPKLHLALVPPDPSWGRERVLEALTACGRFERDGRSRLLYSAPAAPGQPARLFANGVAHRAPPGLLGFLSLLANRRILSRDEANPWLARPQAAELLAALFNAGHFLPPGGGDHPSPAAP